MVIYRYDEAEQMDIAIELTLQEMYDAWDEAQRADAHKIIKCRVENAFEDGTCYLNGNTLDEIVSQGVSDFMDSIENDTTREWAYDDAVATILRLYAIENTIS